MKWFERLWMKWFTVHIGLSVVDDLAVLHVDPTNLHKVAVVRAITTVTTIKFYFYNIILIRLKILTTIIFQITFLWYLNKTPNFSMKRLQMISF